MEEIVKVIKASNTNSTTTDRIMSHLNPLLTAYMKLQDKEAMEKKDEDDEEDTEDEEDEEDEEELFYKIFVLNSDDLWEALHEEEQKIEDFFQMRRKK